MHQKTFIRIGEDPVFSELIGLFYERTVKEYFSKYTFKKVYDSSSGLENRIVDKSKARRIVRQKGIKETIANKLFSRWGKVVFADDKGYINEAAVRSFCTQISILPDLEERIETIDKQNHECYNLSLHRKDDFLLREETVAKIKDLLLEQTDFQELAKKTQGDIELIARYVNDCLGKLARQYRHNPDKLKEPVRKRKPKKEYAKRFIVEIPEHEREKKKREYENKIKETEKIKTTLKHIRKTIDKKNKNKKTDNPAEQDPSQGGKTKATAKSKPLIPLGNSQRQKIKVTKRNIDLKEYSDEKAQEIFVNWLKYHHGKITKTAISVGICPKVASRIAHGQHEVALENEKIFPRIGYHELYKAVEYLKETDNIEKTHKVYGINKDTLRVLHNFNYRYFQEKTTPPTKEQFIAAVINALEEKYKVKKVTQEIFINWLKYHHGNIAKTAKSLGINIKKASKIANEQKEVALERERQLYNTPYNQLLYGLECYKEADKNTVEGSRLSGIRRQTLADLWRLNGLKVKLRRDFSISDKEVYLTYVREGSKKRTAKSLDMNKGSVVVRVKRYVIGHIISGLQKRLTSQAQFSSSR